LFRIFPQNFIRGNAATNNTPNAGEKNYRGKVKELELFQYTVQDRLDCAHFIGSRLKTSK
jgi:hypothetical protein